MSRNTSIVDLNQTHWDAVTVSYPNVTTEVYQFRKDGVSGAVAFTLTITYTDSSKTFVSTISREPKRIG